MGRVNAWFDLSTLVLVLWSVRGGQRRRLARDLLLFKDQVLLCTVVL